MTKPGVPSFGATLVGKEFEWTHLGEDGSVVSETYRAQSSISFDDVLEYKSIGAMLRVDGEMHLKRLTRRGEAIESDAESSKPMEEIRAELDELAEQTVEHERTRWERILAQTLLLVAPKDRERLAPRLAQANPADVTALRSWLVDEVLAKAPAEVEAVADVDPTLPPPPQDSANSSPGGPASEETESTSTD